MSTKMRQGILHSNLEHLGKLWNEQDLIRHKKRIWNQ